MLGEVNPDRVAEATQGHDEASAETQSQTEVKNKLMAITRNLGSEGWTLYGHLYQSAQSYLSNMKTLHGIQSADRAALDQASAEAEHKMMMLAHQFELQIGDLGIHPLWTRPEDAAVGIIAAFESSR